MSPGRPPGARLTTPPRIAFNEGQCPGIQFTERMTGWLGPAPAPMPFQCLPYQFRRCQYEKGAEQGRVAGRRLEVLLTVTGNDIEALLYEQEHPASFAGTARAWGLRGETPDLPEVLAVTGGKLELFTIDPQGVHSRRMNYGADVTTLDGRAWRLLGFKSIMGGGVPDFDGPGGRQNRLPMSAWQDLTRLFVSLHPLSAEDKSFLGILTLSGKDFARQLLTIRGTGGDGVVERFDTAVRFFAFFGSVLRDTYGGSFARGRYAAPNWARGSHRSLRPWARLPQANTNPGLLRNDKVIVHAGDGSPMRLTRIWGKTQPGRLPIILAPGFGVRAMSYATDTVRPNLVESLCGEGYEVWLLDHRASPELAPTRPPFTLDHVAHADWPAAVETVLRLTNACQVNVLTHCLNGASFMMAALSGLLSGKIRAALVSQLATHPVTSTINEVRIMAGLGPILRLFGVKRLQVTVDVRGRLRPSVMGWMLKHYPTSDPCDNPICRRIRFIFGESYLHANLDRVTHDSIIEMFGTPDNDAPATMDLRALLHVTRMVSAGHLVDEHGKNVYLTQDAADKLDFPLALMGGECNALFLPAGLEEAEAWLTRHHEQPKRIKIPNYGHMDCFIGARAHEDVFPKIIAWLQDPTAP